MSMMLLLAVLKILSFNGSGGSPSGVNARDELNDERMNYRSLPDGRACQICAMIRRFDMVLSKKSPLLLGGWYFKRWGWYFGRVEVLEGKQLRYIFAT